jgi:hypothetical protein
MDVVLVGCLMLTLKSYKLCLIVTEVNRRRIEVLTMDFFTHFSHKLIVRKQRIGIMQ